MIGISVKRFAGGVLFSLLAAFLLGALTVLSNLSDKIGFGGDKGVILFPLFFGMPLGGMIGFLIVDKKILKIQELSSFSAIIAFITGIIGCFVSLFLLDLLGGVSFYIVPILVVGFGLAGYSVPKPSRFSAG